MKWITRALSVAIFFLLLSMLSIETSAQTKPWIAPTGALAAKNPLDGKTELLKEGKALYINNCAPCHGQKGKGDGPAAAALIPKPADHTSLALKNETDGSLFWKISEGRTPMPQYKAVFTETQRWELVNYIRSLSVSAKK